MKFFGCLKQPCGRVEKQGSQQHNIEMTFPSLEAALELLRPHLFLHTDIYKNQKYRVDPVTREASWNASKSVDTYRIEDEYQLGEYLSLHSRGLDKKLMLYDGSKLAPITKTSGYSHATVACTFLPPLILEVVRRGRPRVVVLKGEVQSQVFNDLGGQMLPPHYEYGKGMDLQFKELTLYHLSGMRRRGYPLSKKFLTILEDATPRPHTDDEDSADGSGGPPEAQHAPYNQAEVLPLPTNTHAVLCAELLTLCCVALCCQDWEMEPQSGSGDEGDGGEWLPPR